MRTQPRFSTTLVSDATAPSQAHLVVMELSGIRRHPLPATGELIVGRAPPADIVIYDGSVSRQHALLQLNGGRLELEDLASRNGTYVRGRRLGPGDRVSFNAEEVLRFGNVVAIVDGAALTQVDGGAAIELAELVDTLRASPGAGSGSRFAVMLVAFDDSPPPRIVADLARMALREGDLVARRSELQILLRLTADDPVALEQTIAKVLSVCRDRFGRCRAATRRVPDERDHATDVVAELAAEVEVVELGNGFVVRDRRMRELCDLVRRIGVGSLPVVLVGETGVGKEVIAELIHTCSDRSADPFVRINCAAFAETLFEGEFFGYERGAFTGAHAAKPGLLEHAGRGTVFLDELGEMPLTVQAKLLRVLEERAVTRIGALQPRPIHARFVAATNRDLEREVERGAFRRDLYFRLAGVQLEIPPLRERTDELLPLVEHFLNATARDLGRDRTPELDPTAVDALRGHDWPGNVRELRNVIERAVLLCSGPIIRAEHLLLTGPASPRRADRQTAPAPIAARPSPPTESTRERLLWALERTAGNQTEAARLLGVSRRTMSNWLARFGVSGPRKKRE